MVGIPDLITFANFGDDRLRGLEVAGCQSLPFSIDFDRRPYNTLALAFSTELDLGHFFVTQPILAQIFLHTTNATRPTAVITQPNPSSTLGN